MKSGDREQADCINRFPPLYPPGDAVVRNITITLTTLSVYSPRGGFLDDSEPFSLSIQTVNPSNCRDRYLTYIDLIQGKALEKLMIH